MLFFIVICMCSRIIMSVESFPVLMGVEQTPMSAARLVMAAQPHVQQPVHVWVYNKDQLCESRGLAFTEELIFHHLLYHDKAEVSSLFHRWNSVPQAQNEQLRLESNR